MRSRRRYDAKTTRSRRGRRCRPAPAVSPRASRGARAAGIGPRDQRVVLAPSWCCRCRSASRRTSRVRCTAARRSRRPRPSSSRRRACATARRARRRTSRPSTRKCCPRTSPSARRMTHLAVPAEGARAQRVQFQRGATNGEQLRESSLDRLTVSMTLSGDIRRYPRAHLRPRDVAGLLRHRQHGR